MDFLKCGLLKISKTKGLTATNTKSIEEATFTSCYNLWKDDKSEMNDPSYKCIPKFYFLVPEDEDELPLKLREEARTVFLQRRGVKLPDNNELKDLWPLLDKHSTNIDEQLITYEDFKKVTEATGNKCKNYLTSTVFAKLQQNDPYYRVSTTALFNYAMRKVWLHQTRIGLSLYDVTGQGYLKETDLESYITDLIPTMPQLDGLEKSFHKFYVCTAVRKFLFFLDPLRTGKMRIQDILACSFLDDLLQLRDEVLEKDLQDANWFSAPSALRVYGQYLNLDRDHNGMLSKEELAGFSTGTLTNVFLDSVFQECLTYKKEMDYKTYLDFVLALENRKEPQSLQYLFRILDTNGKGYLDTFTLNYFFRAIQELVRQNRNEPVPFQNVKDEIFDMVRPEDPTKITLQDILNSGKGETVINILIDLNGFWNHETRESQVADDPTNI